MFSNFTANHSLFTNQRNCAELSASAGSALTGMFCGPSPLVVFKMTLFIFLTAAAPAKIISSQVFGRRL
jgi:hypothetical protein